MSRALVVVAAAVRFACELGALVSLGWWGWVVGGDVAGWPLGLALAVLVPLVAAVVWAAFCSPRRRFRLGRAATLAVQASVFLAACAALVALRQGDLAVLLAGAALASGGVLALLEPSIAALERQSATPAR